jgi:hypothetical protein
MLAQGVQRRARAFVAFVLMGTIPTFAAVCAHMTMQRGQQHLRSSARGGGALRLPLLRNGTPGSSASNTPGCNAQGSPDRAKDPVWRVPAAYKR